MQHDIFGIAIRDYYHTRKENSIKVLSSDFDDDEIPIPYLFRDYKEMPKIEQKALDLSKGRILDVGCGAGHLLHSMKEAGFNNLLGIDPFNKKDIEYDNGLTIVKNSIHDLPVKSTAEKDTSGDWDLIMYNHSYEHVYDQVEVLKKTWQLLKPDGICMLRIPTVTSWAWRHYSEDWVQLDAPRHFFLHSVKSVNLLAEKTGFALEDVVYDSFAFQSWGSEQYKRDIALNDETSYAVDPKKSLFSKDEIRSYKEHSKILNKSKAGDQAAFYLKKQA